MTARELIQCIEEMTEQVSISENVVEFAIEDIVVILIFDENADRMRIISPIMAVEDMEPEQMERAMVANFHTALDARYAISNGSVWAIFLHPLSELSRSFFISAVGQVVTAAVTFGSDYTGGHLQFGG